MSKKRKANSQIVDGLPEGVQVPRIAPENPQAGTSTFVLDGPQDPGVPASNLETGVEVLDTDPNDEKYLLHPDDPTNFLKLSTALRILIKRRLTNEDINLADRSLREYGAELIKACIMLSYLLLHPSESDIVIRSFTARKLSSQTITTPHTSLNTA